MKQFNAAVLNLTSLFNNCAHKVLMLNSMNKQSCNVLSVIADSTDLFNSKNGYRDAKDSGLFLLNLAAIVKKLCWKHLAFPTISKDIMLSRCLI